MGGEREWCSVTPRGSLWDLVPAAQCARWLESIIWFRECCHWWVHLWYISESWPWFSRAQRAEKGHAGLVQLPCCGQERCTDKEQAQETTNISLRGCRPPSMYEVWGTVNLSGALLHLRQTPQCLNDSLEHSQPSKSHIEGTWAGGSVTDLIPHPMVSFLQRKDHHIICKVNVFSFGEEVPISLWRGRNMPSSHGWMNWNHHKRVLKEFYHKCAPSHCKYVANLAPTRYFLAHKVLQDYLLWPLPRKGCRDWGVFPIP